MTLSLERFENVRNTEKIILVDVSDAVKKCVSKKYRDVEIITHSIKPSKMIMKIESAHMKEY